MTDGKIMVPFIRPQEGGLSRNPDDPASKNPCPFEYRNLIGWHTSSGITWPVWVSMFGDTQASANRFFAMDDEDWYSVFKIKFWDAILGDDIKSQRIADMIADWVWASGKYYPEREVQDVLNHIHSHLVEDGNFGPATIAEVNDAPEEELYNDIIAEHKQYILNIIAANPKLAEFKTDWMRRIDDLVEFNLKLVA